jgi:hypothetical protein
VAGPSAARPGEKGLLLQASGLLVISLLPRLVDLGVFITWDELMWVHRSVHFGQALLSGNWAATFRTGHPGVTTTWLGALGIGLQRLLTALPSPQAWSGLLQLSSLDPQNAEALRQLAPLLVATEIPIAVFTALIVVLFWFLARSVMGPRVALWGAVLNALDPFLLAYSRVVHLDALLAGLMSVGLLSLLVHLYRPSGLRWLLLSAVAIGMAVLTKSPALFMLPLGVTLIAFCGKRRVRTVMLWSVVAMATYVAFWPSMWVQPLDTMRLVLDKSIGYAGHAEETSQFFRGIGGTDPGLLFYPVVLLFRASPLTLFGLAAALLLLRRENQGRRGVWAALATYVLLFGLAMSLGAKKFDRYLLPCVFALNSIAALGWVLLGRRIMRSSRRSVNADQKLPQGEPLQLAGGSNPGSAYCTKWMLTGGAALALIQSLLVLPSHPYYLAWYNPLVGGLREAVRVLPVGWGEGLEKAADYLNSLPNAELLTVSSSGMPGMAPKFKGRTLALARPSLIQADYAVIYVSDRQGSPSPVDDLMSEAALQYVAYIDGVEYAWVYANESQRATLERMSSQGKAGDAVLISGPSLVAEHYEGPMVSHVLQESQSEATTLAALREVAAGRERIWYLQFPVRTSAAGSIAYHQLASHAYLVSHWESSLTSLSLYEMPEGVDFAPIRLRATDGPVIFGDQLRLLRYGLADPCIGWGQSLGVRLEWESMTALPQDCTVFLHLIDETGHLWGQVDLPLLSARAENSTARTAAEPVSVSYLLAPWPAIPPGSYRLVGGVYHSDTQQRLPVIDSQGHERGTTIALGSVQVSPSPVHPTVAELAIPHPLRREIGDSVLLLGYELWPATVHPGTSLHLELFWSVKGTVAEDLTLLLELGGVREMLPIPNSYYPSTRWTTGDVLRGQFELSIPADLPPDDYALHLNLVEPSGKRLSTNDVSIGHVQVEGRTRIFDIPTMTCALDLLLGDEIKLLGYDAPKLETGTESELSVTLYWQAERTTDSAYMAFVHVLDSEGQLIAQRDSSPQNGAAPTTSWLSGEVIRDEYTITVPSEVLAGPLGIEVGMYDPTTGERLPVYDMLGSRLEDDRALLTTLERE